MRRSLLGRKLAALALLSVLALPSIAAQAHPPQGAGSTQMVKHPPAIQGGAELPLPEMLVQGSTRTGSESGGWGLGALARTHRVPPGQHFLVPLASEGKGGTFLILAPPPRSFSSWLALPGAWSPYFSGEASTNAGSLNP